ncbi:hypothetical protein [Halorubrum sp. LN27]|uniref:hypothetical protein n=1 Tax=Halorubrum sp. LN27 TaxID=2801032 RepID=UPI00190A1A5C|nr:hypothetical protein [Halorubrum sp. LN27]
MTESVRESVTRHWAAEKILMLVFGLVFGVTFVRDLVPRHGAINYQALGWVLLSAAFWYAIGVAASVSLGWI